MVQATWNTAGTTQVIQLYNKLFNQPLPILLRLKLEFRIHWSKHALRLYGLRIYEANQLQTYVTMFVQTVWKSVNINLYVPL